MRFAEICFLCKSHPKAPLSTSLSVFLSPLGPVPKSYLIPAISKAPDIIIQREQEESQVTPKEPCLIYRTNASYTHNQGTAGSKLSCSRQHCLLNHSHTVET